MLLMYWNFKLINRSKVTLKDKNKKVNILYLIIFMTLVCDALWWFIEAIVSSKLAIRLYVIWET